MSTERESARSAAIDVLLACEAQVDLVVHRLKESEETHDCIKSLLDKKRLDLGGAWLIAMEADMYKLRAATALTKSTLDDARKAVTRASSSLVEADLAKRLNEADLVKTCTNDADEAIAMALARTEEVHALAEACSNLFKGLRFPMLYVRV